MAAKSFYSLCKGLADATFYYSFDLSFFGTSAFRRAWVIAAIGSRPGEQNRSNGCSRGRRRQERAVEAGRRDLRRVGRTANAHLAGRQMVGMGKIRRRQRQRPTCVQFNFVEPYGK